MQQAILEQAKAGHLPSLAQVMNQSLGKQGIQASLELESGFLEVMLDAQHLPAKKISELIVNGLRRLNPPGIYTVTIYARQKGQLFAGWCEIYELKQKPLQPSGAVGLNVSITSGSEIHLELPQLLGFLGAILLLIGVFSPILSLPLQANITYFRDGAVEAWALIILAIATIIFLAQKRFAWIYGTGLWALLLVSLSYFSLSSKISEAKQDLSRDLSGNPFRGLAEVATASIQLQWGWIILFLGSSLILTAAYLKQSKLNRQAFASIGVAFAGLIIFAVIQPSIDQAMYSGQASKAQESEAQTYIGSINRGQQVFYLEQERFASSLDELMLGIKDSEYYKYEVVESESDLTVSTALPQKGGLRSFVGGVFLVELADGEKRTVTISCSSKNATRKMPAPPILQDNKLVCASDSVRF